MASTSPPILPTSTPPPSTTTTIPTTISTTTASYSPPPTAFRSFINRLNDQFSSALINRRPWSELSDRTAFSKPESLSDATTRIRKNYSYFRVNYLIIIIAALAFSLFSHPFSLIILSSLLAAWSFLYLFKQPDQNVILFGRNFSDKETLGLLVVTSIFVVFLTNVGAVLMSALVVGSAIVCVHGAFRIPEDLFLDDQEPGPGSFGFLSFLGDATKNVSVAASQTAVNPRV